MSQVPDALRSALSDRYDLERVLGRGGMATVYLAHDLKHKRSVAVKVLRPELAASIGTDRFLKEIEIAARLTHPHIVALYDSGEARGFLYYVMPFIEGESLRSLLNRERWLEPERAFTITARVGEALGYAHRQGVVHRDIKPENILFAQGHPMVADFGIARAISTAGGVELTRTGFPLGTPGYMSPEQAAGVRELDERTDVYSLACVCYEMLVGVTPGMWLTDEAVRLGRFIDARPPDRERLDTFSSSIERALVRALALRPGDRFATPGEFVDGLLDRRSGPRKYSDAEVQQIVKLATEAQVEHPTETGALSLGAVQQIAAEVGISPERVERAARELEHARLPDPPPPTPASRIFLGAPTMLRFERIVQGEVTEAEFPALVDEIRLTIGTVGQASTLGGTLTWSTTPAQQGVGRAVHVMISPRAGQTRIRVEEHLGQLAGGLFGGLMGGAGGGGTGGILGISLGALHASPAAAIASVAAWITSTYLGARIIFRRITGKRSRQLRELVDRLADEISETARRRVLDGGIRGRLPR